MKGEISMMKKLILVLLAMMLMGGSFAMGEFVSEPWYAEALKGCEMSQGNNLRLKKVIDRAQSGEVITIATVGGSITEGAAASTYAECWACRFAKRFGTAYGTANGKNVELINSGVGGTPSPFGWMRYGRDVLERVSERDPDGYPDIVVIEYAVNDWEEPTKGRCYESMVKEILSQPNKPAVILLFSSRKDGWNLQGKLRKVGDRYDLMMVSISDGIHPHIDSDFPAEEWYKDDYHPKSVGHRMMADALMQAIEDANAAETASADIDLDVEPVFGTDFMGLQTVYGDRDAEGFTVERGGFDKNDFQAYRNQPVGLVCGLNFHHDLTSPDEPLKITGTFRKLLVAWKATADTTFGAAEILVDGQVKKTLKNGSGKWGQSEVVLVFDAAEAEEHTVEIRVTEEKKCFTVTAVSFQ